MHRRLNILLKPGPYQPLADDLRSLACGISKIKLVSETLTFLGVEAGRVNLRGENSVRCALPNP